MTQFVFTAFTKEHRPLSRALWERVRSLSDNLRSANNLEDLEPFSVDRIPEIVAGLGLKAPTLGRTRHAGERDGPTRWNEDRSLGVGTSRHLVTIEIHGDASLLNHWPDVAGAHLVPPDTAVVEEIGGLDALHNASQADVSRWSLAQELWQLHLDDANAANATATGHLRTFVDLTQDEEAQVASGDLDIVQIVRDRRAEIEPVVAAVGQQIAAFLDEELPERLGEAIETKRNQVTNRQAVRDSLSFPEEWHSTEPALENLPEPRPKRFGNPVAEMLRPRISTAPGPWSGVPTPSAVTIDPRERLTPATFAEVLFTLRHWANAVERYPKAFGLLAEDRISDLLAATCNAALPGAGREVYTQNGKSDIFIHADAIDPSRGAARIFICEVKKATSKDVIHKALDPQLFGYLNVHDTKAVLLILLGQKRFAPARTSYRRVLEGVSGYRGTSDGPVADWPLLKYMRNGQLVTVCAAFVHLPKT